MPDFVNANACYNFEESKFQADKIGKWMSKKTPWGISFPRYLKLNSFITTIYVRSKCFIILCPTIPSIFFPQCRRAFPG
jgi:hypothetical protein